MGLENEVDIEVLFARSARPESASALFSEDEIEQRKRKIMEMLVAQRISYQEHAEGSISFSSSCSRFTFSFSVLECFL